MPDTTATIANTVKLFTRFPLPGAHVLPSELHYHTAASARL
jgi:hypothetical protein